MRILFELFILNFRIILYTEYQSIKHGGDMEDLTKIEETVLIAIWQLGDQAYGYRIRKHILSVFEKEFSIGNLYSVLNQLDRKAYVSKSIEESGERRRGKPKVFYSVTDEGILALNESRRSHNLIWEKIPQQAFEITEP